MSAPGDLAGLLLSALAAAGWRGGKVLVALSGGSDSMALLGAVSQAGIDAAALHVHHGLSPNADAWEAFCRGACTHLGIEFACEHVHVDSSRGGVEAAARAARYAALEACARRIGAGFILMAHHREDVLETFLIEWMRGAGLAGLAGPAPARVLDGGATLVRPFLSVARENLAQAAQELGLGWVEDESNSDTAYLRNALRHNALPALDAARPGWRDAALRSVQLIARACRTERPVLLAGEAGGPLALARLVASGNPSGLLLAWLASAGFSASSAAAGEILKGCLADGFCFRQGCRTVRRSGMALVLESEHNPGPAVELAWKGESEIAVPSWGGLLRFEKAPAGVRPELLASFVLSKARGGELFCIARERPRQSLKKLWASQGIPAWKRRSYPVLRQGTELLWAQGLGASACCSSSPGIVLSWAWDQGGGGKVDCCQGSARGQK